MDKIVIPPLKCQGIKTKLVSFIKDTFMYNNKGIWFEPFVGTGAVVFNINPKRAILSDKNEHNINFYNQIQLGNITKNIVRDFLEYHGEKLKVEGQDYYLKMRKEFNETHDSLLYLFLNRSDFNGMIRFNKKGYFNVPYCHNDNRFSKAYITKICNQVNAVAEIIQFKDWEFRACPWQETFKLVSKNDFIYLDPPYIGRDTSYVGEWSESEAIELSKYAHETNGHVCLSMWKENKFRKNEHLIQYWSDFAWYEQKHFYHIGAKESNRHEMIEVLAIK